MSRRALVLLRARLSGSQAENLPVAPLVLLLDPDQPGCHVCVWAPVQGIGPDKHRGYAVQWFALAVALVVLCGVVLRRVRSDAG